MFSETFILFFFRCATPTDSCRLHRKQRIREKNNVMHGGPWLITTFRQKIGWTQNPERKTRKSVYYMISYHVFGMRHAFMQNTVHRPDVAVIKAVRLSNVSSQTLYENCSMTGLLAILIKNTAIATAILHVIIFRVFIKPNSFYLSGTGSPG